MFMSLPRPMRAAAIVAVIMFTVCRKIIKSPGAQPVLIYCFTKIKQNYLSSSSVRNIMSWDSMWLERARVVVPQLTSTQHKGQAGRIGVVGGSLEYTGAPYFTAISSLLVGADLVHVFCAAPAAAVIKSYSPELIVHPILDSLDAIEQIDPWLERLHVLVIGPGLGRDPLIQKTVRSLITRCRLLKKPLVIDADGLFLITQEIDLIKDYDGVILTPNAVEFTRLFGTQREDIPQQLIKLGLGVTVLEKGLNDRIYESSSGLTVLECPEGGSSRRCGGQGDLLAGAIATFYGWALHAGDPRAAQLACFVGSLIAKECNRQAYQRKGRSMITSDMIQEIHNVFNDVFEHKSKSN